MFFLSLQYFINQNLRNLIDLLHYFVEKKDVANGKFLRFQHYNFLKTIIKIVTLHSSFCFACFFIFRYKQFLSDIIYNSLLCIHGKASLFLLKTLT